MENPTGKYKCKTTGKQIIIFHPNNPGVGFVEIEQDMARKALEEIEKKLPMVQAGIDKFTECEKMLFMLFMNNAKH